MTTQYPHEEQTVAQAPGPWRRSPDEPDVIVDAAGQPVARFIQQPGRSVHANIDRVLTVLYACLPLPSAALKQGFIRELVELCDAARRFDPDKNVAAQARKLADHAERIADMVGGAEVFDDLADDLVILEGAFLDLLEASEQARAVLARSPKVKALPLYGRLDRAVRRGRAAMQAVVHDEPLQGLDLVAMFQAIKDAPSIGQCAYCQEPASRFTGTPTLCGQTVHEGECYVAHVAGCDACIERANEEGS